MSDHSAKSGLSLLHALAWPTYAVALFLIAMPLMDFVANVWPPAPGLATWRYASAGILSGFLMTPMVGVVMAFAAASVLDQRRSLKVFGILAAVVAVILIAAALLFVLDVLQVRATLEEEERTRILIGGAMALVKYLVAAGCLVWLSLAGIRASRGARSDRKGRGSGPILVERSK